MSDKALTSSVPHKDPSSVVKNSLRFGKQHSTDDIDIRQVSSLQDFFTGMGKLHAEYLKLGLVAPQPGNMLFSPWFFTAANRLFLAKVDNDVIGTIALIKQSGQGLPAEKIFAEEICQSGCQPEHTGEIGSLCIDACYRGGGVLRALYGWIILYAAFFQRIDTLFIQVEARKARFYQDNLFFHQVGESRLHPAYQNKPVVLLRADIRQTLAFLRKSLSPHKRLSVKEVMVSMNISSMYHKLVACMKEEKVFRWTAEHARHYCDRCCVKNDALSSKQRAALHSILNRHL
ncbi:GNAT family N-acetyltransferase [Erwiniaceae bacterium BAC15a-03b]|uniref:GNAT family N-acetyltransferase n=1 Tax=Winslowiella arboricola TaxID=2978220 RepID=A0A9J6PQE0_9GAMM|nr:GNAT family N-acetyltransferase [Winslowiella arboricola]MCU5772992.1 GNAT family N-acetyltransferase [Winslowiella arboricola]MCU5777893.1 GNAT family N-acetyltransferase [Winslowiella arboricola]